MSSRVSFQSGSFYGNDLAYLHNAHYADYVRLVAPRLAKLLRSKGIKNGVVCDLGCGGGQLTGYLTTQGYDAIGFDVSRAMIKAAKAAYPRSKFIMVSIESVSLPKCAAAVAVGEIINCLGSKERMACVFRNVFHALEPGGLFIFDIKTPSRKPLSRSSCNFGSDWAIFVDVIESSRERELLRKIVSFRKRGKIYRRQDEFHRLSLLKPAECAGLLREVGFSARVLSGFGGYRLPDGRKVLMASKKLKSNRSFR